MVLGSLIGTLGAVFAVGLWIANLAIAIGVYRDARLVLCSARMSLKIFSPAAWALICFFGSIPALAIYWAAHHSTLARTENL